MTMSKPTKSNSTKVPRPSSLPPPQTPPNSPNNEDPQQHVTMEQLQQIFMAALRQAKQPSESSEPIGDVKSEKCKDKGGNEVKARASKLEYKEVHEVYVPSSRTLILLMLTAS